MKLKAQFELLKQKRKADGKTFIQYKDVINEKLKENKEEQLLKDFKKEEIKDKPEEVDILSLPPSKKLKISEDKKETLIKESSQKEISSNNSNKDEKEEENNILNDEDIEDESTKRPKTKEDYPLSINPSEIIKEIKDNETTKRVVEAENYPYDFKCDQLYNWFHQTFIEWEKSFEEIVATSIDEVKTKMGVYKQCRGYIKILLINLKERKVTKFILDKLFQVMVFCIDGDYIRAHDSYIELAIGNSPWPIGVTMVGIHERSGRSRIYTSQVAYILNDDITKKYLQSVKRVLTFIQRRYPQSPSKCVFS